MPIRPSVPENIRHLQRQINQQGTGRFGPMSIGPGEGHLRFYAADGSVLFEADSSGARVQSRGSLAGLTSLLDSIRDKDDDQDGTLGQHSSTLGEHSSTLGNHSSRIDTLHSRANSQDTLNATQNGQISQLQADLTYQTDRIDNRATVGQLDATNNRVTNVEAKNSAQDTRLTNVEAKNSSQDTRLTNVEARNTAQDGRLDTLHSRANSQDQTNAAQNGRISQVEVDVTNARSRADSAYSRAGTGISDAAAAHSRANAAYDLAVGRATQAQIEWINDQLAGIRARVSELEEWRKSFLN